jgi:hypothetical protein
MNGELVLLILTTFSNLKSHIRDSLNDKQKLAWLWA